MNKGTKIRTVLAIATSIHTALIATDVTGFNNSTVDTIYKVLSIVANFVVIALTTYYNNDYTEIACKHTGAARLEKEQMKKGVITGENFFDESEEIEEGEQPSIEVTTEDGELIASIGAEDVIVKDGYDIKGGEIDG